MMQAVRGVYRSGVVELLEKPNVVGDAEVVVTFLTAGSTLEMGEDSMEPAQLAITENAPPLDEFEPIVPANPIRLSDLVLEDRR
jgi:hypothetical protein